MSGAAPPLPDFWQAAIASLQKRVADLTARLAEIDQAKRAAEAKRQAEYPRREG